MKKQPNKNLTFIYSGSYGRKDGVDLVIKAFDKLIDKYSNIQLLLSGKINSEIALLIKGNLNIVYAGMIPDNEYYQFLQNQSCF